MSTPDPAHIDAVVRAMDDPYVWVGTTDEAGEDLWVDGVIERDDARKIAGTILDSTDPAVHAAMLDALVRHGVLTEDTRTRLDGYGGMVDTGTGAGPMVIARAATSERRLVTSWEVTP